MSSEGGADAVEGVVSEASISDTSLPSEGDAEATWVGGELLQEPEEALAQDASEIVEETVEEAVDIEAEAESEVEVDEPSLEETPREEEELDPETLAECKEVLEDEIAEADGPVADEEITSETKGADVTGSDSEQYLVEEVYPPSTPTQALSVGDEIGFREQTFVVEAVFEREHYRVNGIGETPEQEHYLFGRKARSAVVQGLRPHKMLPKVLGEDGEGCMYEWLEGTPLQAPMTFHEALSVLQPLSQLLRFLESQRLALVDLVPSALISSEAGTRLRLPPMVVAVDEAVSLVPRDGFSPPEVLHEGGARASSGVYLWGALLYHLCTGKHLPTEGLNQEALRACQEPHLPQLLSATLEPYAEYRIGAAEVQQRVKRILRPQAPRLKVAAATTVGLNPTRSNNEDSYGYLLQAIETDDGRQQLLRACVADGMGGEEAGEVASKAAVEAFLAASIRKDLADEAAQVAWNVDAVWQANAAVFDALHASGGCTFTSVAIVDDRLTLGHVGDSRAYLYRPNTGLAVLSRDHSFVYAMLMNGQIDEDEAENSPDTNKVLRSLGTKRNRTEASNYVDDLASLVDSAGNPLRQSSLDLEAGDIVLLMSDGVWGVWGYREGRITAKLEGFVERHQDIHDLVDALVAEALAQGADDNATIVAIQAV